MILHIARWQPTHRRTDPSNIIHLVLLRRVCFLCYPQSRVIVCTHLEIKRLWQGSHLHWRLLNFRKQSVPRAPVESQDKIQGLHTASMRQTGD